MIERARRWLLRARSVPASVEETRRLAEQAAPDAVLQRLDVVLQRLDAVTAALDAVRHEAWQANVTAATLAARQDDTDRRLTDELERLRLVADGAARAASAAAGQAAAERALRDHGVDHRVTGCSVLVVAVDGHDDASATIHDATRMLDRLADADADAVVVVVAAPTADLRAADVGAAGLLDHHRGVRVVRLDVDLPLAEATALALRCCPTRHALVTLAGDRLDLDGTVALAEAARSLDATIVYGETLGLAPVVTVPDGRPQTRVVRSLSAPPARTGEVEAAVEALLPVVDVDRVLAAGAISTRSDLRLSGADAELLQRLLDRGELVVWVPVVTGRRPVAGLGDDHRRAVASAHASAAIRAGRPAVPAERAVVVWHPATGVIESTTAARRHGV